MMVTRGLPSAVISSVIKNKMITRSQMKEIYVIFTHLWMKICLRKRSWKGVTFVEK